MTTRFWKDMKMVWTKKLVDLKMSVPFDMLKNSLQFYGEINPSIRLVISALSVCVCVCVCV